MSLLDRRNDWLKMTREAGASEANRYHVAVAATFTAEPIAPYLGTRLLGSDSLPPVVTIAPYNQILQLCNNWSAYFGENPPKAIVILWRSEDFARADFQAVLRGASPDRLLAAIDELADAVAVLRKSFKGTIICSVTPFPHSPDHHIRGLGSITTAGALHRRVVDAWISRVLQIDNVGLFDLDGLQRFMGIEAAIDWRKWYLYRQPYSERFWDLIGEQLAALIRSQTAASKKCVVVDCDGTLWGGIIGEDGLSGIALGEDYPGSVFRDFQNQLLTLRSQGVMVAICSKNNIADVWEVFDRHDGMVLERDDIVAARINWIDKPTNLISLAEELNIGLDSFVFVDDSPMEIEHVKSALPMVTCFLVPSELTHFVRDFGAYRGFDRETVSAEDRRRSDMMLEERKRREFGAALGVEDFRRQLQLSIDVFRVQDEHIARVTQLINKTNQFNLTTRRRTEAEVKTLVADPGAAVLAWKVSDRFGDYGLVGVAILAHGAETTTIDTLLMSCRVLGRGVEQAVFSSVCNLARSHGAERLVGRYVKSSKNNMVERLYEDYGFSKTSDGSFELRQLEAIVWPVEIARPGL
jgi:FkbH-like protein